MPKSNKTSKAAVKPVMARSPAAKSPATKSQTIKSRDQTGAAGAARHQGRHGRPTRAKAGRGGG